MKMNKLIKDVEQWFYDRGLENADPTKQMLKLFEESGELAEGLAKDNTELIVDALGDTLVVLIGLSLQLDLDLEQCLTVAYNEIKDRQGKVINGVFVKEDDIK